MLFDVQAYTTVTIEADSIEAAKQLLKDKCDKAGYVNLSQSTSNDNGYIFMMASIHHTQVIKSL